MFNVRFDANHFASEVKTVIEEINMRSNDTRIFVSENLFAMMFPQGHPLHHSVCGNKEDLLRATSADLRKFYQRNYHPSKALLTIIGDINCDEALEHARKAFGTTVPVPAPTQLTWDDTLTVQKERTLYRPAEACYANGWKLPAQWITEEEIFALEIFLLKDSGQYWLIKQILRTQ